MEKQQEAQSSEKKKMDPGVQIARIVCIVLGLPIILIILAMVIIFIRQATR